MPTSLSLAHAVWTTMMLFRFAFWSLALQIVFALPGPNTNRPTWVNLRIEGADQTIFEGKVRTRGHDVSTPSTITPIHCDGTNNGANAHPGPTCTSALDDAAQKYGFEWDGDYFTEFDDLFITSISGDRNDVTADRFWGILLNWQFTPVGGCQQQIVGGDEVLFAFDAFNAVGGFLKLYGPLFAWVGEEVEFVVTDGLTGNVVSLAEIDGNLSDEEGHVRIVFNEVGVQSLKAKKEGAIRSNEVKVKVVL